MPADKVIPVRVAVRCRPLIPKEQNEGCTTCVTFVPGEPQVVLGADKCFTYDFVFSPATAQETVYEESVSSLVQAIFKGYNATVLAYGQTGSGKTFSMGGNYDILDDSSTEEIRGVIPRVIQDLFNGINDRQEFSYTVKVSYLELYKEDLLDLLEPQKGKDQIVIREGVNGGIRITGLSEVLVGSAQETLDLLEKGASSRTTGATAMNNSSSRSHAIFTIIVERTNKKDSNDFCQSKFHLVDLAGSERQKKTKAEGERFKEGVNINKGLLALGNVISALGDEASKKGHIPYRDSKLTRLLQDSLGGNSHTVMIACISPADSNMEETLSTLRYADRARKIKNKPIVNRDPQQAEIIRLRGLVQQLQSEVTGLKSGGAVLVNTSTSEGPVDVSKLKHRIKELEEENGLLSSQLRESIDQNTDMCQRLIAMEMQRDNFRNVVEELKEQQNALQVSLVNASTQDSMNTSDGAVAPPAELQKTLDAMHRTIALLDKDIQADDDEEETSTETDSQGTAHNMSQNTSLEGPGMSTPNTSFLAQAEKEHDIKHRKLGQELMQLNVLLEQKEKFLKKQVQEGTEFEKLKKQHEVECKKLETDITKLSNEKEELLQQLQTAKHNPAASKIAEQRRKRLQELEAKLAQNKKKLVELSKAAKQKDEVEKQCTKLSQAILAMKQQRVRLMKQIKEESDHFRQFKQQKEKEVMQLKAKGRRKEVEMAKEKQRYERQQNVLKRKNEEAQSANKRLKEALQRQKQAAEERANRGMGPDHGPGGRHKRWVADDLEVAVGIEEVRHHMNQNMKERKQVSARIADNKASLQTPTNKRKKLNDKSYQETSEELEEKRKQIEEDEKYLEILNAQIQEFQQKLMDSDQEERKGRQRWVAVHSLVEAKDILSQLFTSVVKSQVSKTRTVNELKEDLRGAQESRTQLEESLAQAQKDRNNIELEMFAMQRQMEDKVLYVMGQLNNKQDLTKEQLDDKVKKQLRLQAEQIEELGSLSQDLQDKTAECEGLKKELTVLKYRISQHKDRLMPGFDDPNVTGFFTPPTADKASRKIRRSKKQGEEDEEYMSIEEVFEEEEIPLNVEDIDEDATHDPDWVRTPLFKAPISRMKNKQPGVSKDIFSMEKEAEPVKSPADPSPEEPSYLCQCRGDCATNRCKCKKNGAMCADTCKCGSLKCKNREVQMPESTTTDDNSAESAQTSLNSTFTMNAAAADTPTEEDTESSTDDSKMTASSSDATVLKNVTNEPRRSLKRKSEDEFRSNRGYQRQLEDQSDLLETSGIKAKNIKKRTLMSRKANKTFFNEPS